MSSQRSERPSPALAYVIGTYPIPTTTFIDREIDALRRLGVSIQVLSIRRPGLPLLSGSQRQRLEEVHYVLPARIGDLLRSHAGFLRSRPVVYLTTFARLVTRPHPSVRARVRTVLHFGLGVHVARLLQDRYPSDHVHAHFVDRAALVALVAGRLLDRSFSATAHANDIYVDPILLPEKIASAKFIATCTRYNDTHLRSLANGASDKVRCVYHGIDLRDFSPGSSRRHDAPLILSVGQLKEKKGFGDLLDACRILVDREVPFVCEIVGEGPLRASLQARIADLDLDPYVRLVGGLPHDEVIRKYREATIFVLPCVTGPDGDRDGIPNVIIEAMAMGLPVVSTRHSGIPEAVHDERTGLLVPKADPEALALAILRLLSDWKLRDRLGGRGRERVSVLFDVDTNAKALLAAVMA
ncbi:MAG TPA: glycosyltransferase [Actinomycetota bacterium]|nr:glycosyltransferase [Actinomycetota bacterium]